MAFNHNWFSMIEHFWQFEWFSYYIVSHIHSDPTSNSINSAVKISRVTIQMPPSLDMSTQPCLRYTYHWPFTLSFKLEHCKFIKFIIRKNGSSIYVDDTKAIRNRVWMIIQSVRGRCTVKFTIWLDIIKWMICISGFRRPQCVERWEWMLVEGLGVVNTFNQHYIYVLPVPYLLMYQWECQIGTFFYKTLIILLYMMRYNTASEKHRVGTKEKENNRKQ